MNGWDIWIYVGKVKYLRYALYIQYLLHLKNAYTVNTGNNWPNEFLHIENQEGVITESQTQNIERMFLDTVMHQKYIFKFSPSV